MRELRITVPELALVAMTRGLLGLGLGLLVSERLRPARRGTVGWTLIAIGAISTIPLLASVLARPRSDARSRGGATAIMGG